MKKPLLSMLLVSTCFSALNVDAGTLTISGTFFDRSTNTTTYVNGSVDEQQSSSSYSSVNSDPFTLVYNVDIFAAYNAADMSTDRIDLANGYGHWGNTLFTELLSYDNPFAEEFAMLNQVNSSNISFDDNQISKVGGFYDQSGQGDLAYYAFTQISRSFSEQVHEVVTENNVVYSRSRNYYENFYLQMAETAPASYEDRKVATYADILQALIDASGSYYGSLYAADDIGENSANGDYYQANSVTYGGLFNVQYLATQQELDYIAAQANPVNAPAMGLLFLFASGALLRRRLN